MGGNGLKRFFERADKKLIRNSLKKQLTKNQRQQNMINFRNFILLLNFIYSGDGCLPTPTVVSAPTITTTTMFPTCPPSTCTTAFMTDVRAFLTAPMADATCTTYIIQVTCPGLTNTQFNADGASVFAANIPVDITCNSATGMFQYPRLGIPTDVTRIDCA